MLVKRSLLATILVSGAVVAAYAVLVHTENVVSTYPTYSDAIRDGAHDRGWLPPFVPPSAFAIREVHDLDTNRQWIRFSVPADDMAALRGVGAPITLAEARTRHRRPKRWRGTWPPELAGDRVPTARGHLSLREASDQHGRSWCLLLDASATTVHAWTCDRAPD